MASQKRIFQIVGLVLLAFLVTGCFSVSIVENVKNPDRHFRNAYERIEKISRKYPDRRAFPHEIHVLVYEESDRQLVKVCTPLWFVDTCVEAGVSIAEREQDFEFAEKYDFDWHQLKNWKEMGPGLLVEVEDLEEGTKVLVWLE